MNVGTGLAIAGWFMAFVWAAATSDNIAAGVVIAGITAAVLAR